MGTDHKNELVRSYLDGNIGRRVFVKGLIASGITLAGAMAYADVLAPRTARAAAARRQAGSRDPFHLPNGFYNFYVGVVDNSFGPNDVTVLKRGDSVSWGFVGSRDHSVTENSGLDYFDSGFAPPTRIEYTMVFPAAGSFPYHCKDTNHASSMHGVVHVKVGRNPFFGPLGTTFDIQWAQKTADPGYVFDVQVKHGTGPFTSFRNGVTAFQAQFKPSHKGQYLFRGRVRNKATGQASGFSPPSSLFVQ
jgi:plastocyanin